VREDFGISQESFIEDFGNFQCTTIENFGNLFGISLGIQENIAIFANDL
jgi:hypothetical protein